MPESELEYLLFCLILAGYVSTAIALVCVRRLLEQRRPAYQAAAYTVHIERRQKFQWSPEDLTFIRETTKNL